MKPLFAIVITASVALASAACGDAKSSVNAMAPSAVVLDGPQSVESGGVATTQAKGGVPGPPQGKGGNGNDKDKDKQPPTNTTPTNTSPTAPVVKKVEIEGLITAKAGISITVNAQQVVVPSTCPIRHGQTPFTFASLKVGDRVHVRANRTTATGAATTTNTLEATEVILQNAEDGEGSGDDTPTTMVSIAATDALASESPVNTGTFTLTRSGSAAGLASALTVTIAITGSAVNGVDYSTVPLTVTFAAGTATAAIVVTPLVDTNAEGPETVIITVVDGVGYAAGVPAAGTITITG